jgi:hypothetical protein
MRAVFTGGLSNKQGDTLQIIIDVLGHSTRDVVSDQWNSGCVGECQGSHGVFRDSRFDSIPNHEWLDSVICILAMLGQVSGKLPAFRGWYSLEG